MVEQVFPGTTIEPLSPYERLYRDNYGRRNSGIPVDAGSNSPAILRYVLIGDVQPGERFLLYGEANLTNDVGMGIVNGKRVRTGERYTVGVNLSLWYYDAASPSSEGPRQYYQIDGASGMNITVDYHHGTFSLVRFLKIPESWKPGRVLGIQLKSDAHSTSWDVNGGDDEMRVEVAGCLHATRYVLPDVEAVTELTWGGEGPQQ